MGVRYLNTFKNLTTSSLRPPVNITTLNPGGCTDVAQPMAGCVCVHSGQHLVCYVKGWKNVPLKVGWLKAAHPYSSASLWLQVAFDHVPAVHDRNLVTVHEYIAINAHYPPYV